MAKTPILFLGATGYIGGSVLSRLLSHPSRDDFDITALVRSPEKGKKLEGFGVKPAIGSLKDIPLIEQLAQNAHIVFSTADADDLDAITALLAGLKKRHATTNDIPILIHTSGTGLLTAGDAATKGLGISERIYRDDNPDDIESIPPTAFHRNVDLAIIQADKEGYLRSYIIAPGVIWGIAKNQLVEAGISNNFTKGIHWLIQASIARGQAGIVGKGQALWPCVNVEEQGDLFIILYDAIISSPGAVGHGRDGFYFGESGEFLWYDLATSIGKALVKRGISKSDEPASFTDEELAKYFGSKEFGEIFGTNSRAQGPHARSLGWKPKLIAQDFLNNIDADVELATKKQQA
ncbi:NAD-P-binding protein [Irpex rosettiformis]|uniref:NAD-P-binding protein n=1 Tax=Irpex rosettiformis TaxID=378272 RepID=A0ACB8U9J5_9APHY|nr:NAD-P-binding protein [Irpex rosettiformis]